MVGTTKEQLMREAVAITLADNDTGFHNTVFAINIPEDHALELHYAEFICKITSAVVVNNIDMFLTDDPDETGAVSHTDEKTIASTFYHIGAASIDVQELRSVHECFKTLLVQNPNFHITQAEDAGASTYFYCRIWFDFVKVSPREILDLLRQQQV